MQGDLAAFIQSGIVGTRSRQRDSFTLVVQPGPDEGGTMAKVVHCECGTDVEAESEDELVNKVEAHIADSHPDMVGTMSREQILEMSEDK